MLTLFHVAKKSAWEVAKKRGHYLADSLNAEGFIHCSLAHQVLKTAEKHFQGQTGLALLMINEESLNSPLKYEGDKDNLFPHIYGPLNASAVIDAFEFDGNNPELPPSLQVVGNTLIREGRPGDEAEITSCHTHGWLQSYQGIIPDSVLAQRPLSFRNRLLWWKRIVEGKEAERVFVAEAAQYGVIGFCSVGPARGSEFKGQGEISAIYCLNEYKGKGIGAALFRAGLVALKKDNFKSSYLWVLSENPTTKFYENMGGKRLEKVKTVELGVPLIEVAYEWKL